MKITNRPPGNDIVSASESIRTDMPSVDGVSAADARRGFSEIETEIPSLIGLPEKDEH